VESAESANSAVRCSKQTQLNCQSLISAKSYHSLKCLIAHEGLVTHARKVQIVVGHLLFCNVVYSYIFIATVYRGVDPGG